jgi:hypothetical protein
MQLAAGDPMAPLAVMLLARRTDDRHRDVEGPLRDQAAEWLSYAGAAPHLHELVRVGGTLDEEERDEVFGELLPSGLRIV